MSELDFVFDFSQMISSDHWGVVDYNKSVSDLNRINKYKWNLPTRLDRGSGMMK